MKRPPKEVIRPDLIAYVLLCVLMLVFGAIGVASVPVHDWAEFVTGFLLAVLLGVMVAGFVFLRRQQ